MLRSGSRNVQSEMVMSGNTQLEQEVVVIRQKLLEAGLALAGQRARNKAGLEKIDVAAVAEAADVDAAAVYVHFRDRDDLCVGIIEHGLNGIRAEVIAATAAAPAGLTRVLRSLDAYLDGNLARPGMRALLYELRNHAQALELARQRTAAYGVLMGLELANNKMAHGKLLGRLCAVLAVEIAVLEFEVGTRVPDAREQIHALLRRG
jgi:AcrR family transcriptional regulator